MSTPTGLIQTPLPRGNDGVTWEAITRYDDLIAREAHPLGWSTERIRAHIAIESRGNPRAVQHNASNGNSYGLLQCVPFGVGWAGWHELVQDKAGLPRSASQRAVIDALYDPEVNIACGVAILEAFWQQYGQDPDAASSAFFLGNPDWQGGDSENGTSGADYRRALYALHEEQDRFRPADPISVIVGGAPYRIEYGWLADAGLKYYAYGVGHGTHAATQHTGVDVLVPLGTALYAPLPGVVECVGGRGVPRWGQGCGAYNDTITGGVGNITIYTDAGLKLVLGHSNRAYVQPGERVSAGQMVGTSGGMNGPHVHVEVAVERNGAYWLVEPIAALREAMGGAPAPQPQPAYAPRIPVAQPEEFTQSVQVVAVVDGVPVLQGAYPDAPEVGPKLQRGEDFQAVMQQIGIDGRLYWLSTRAARVPVEGTRSAAWEALTGHMPEPPATTCDSVVDAARDAVDAARQDVDTRLRAVMAAIEGSDQ